MSEEPIFWPASGDMACAILRRVNRLLVEKSQEPFISDFGEAADQIRQLIDDGPEALESQGNA